MWFGALEKLHDHQKTPLCKDHGFDPTKTSQHELDPTRREGDSHPDTPQRGEGGRGIPTHHTPHHREGRREGDSQSAPPPTPQKTIWGLGGAAERVTMHIHTCIFVYIYMWLHGNMGFPLYYSRWSSACEDCRERPAPNSQILHSRPFGSRFVGLWSLRSLLFSEPPAWYSYMYIDKVIPACMYIYIDIYIHL